MDAIEIDFLPVGQSAKSGDAIALRYGTADAWETMIVDGGDLAAGEALVKHLRDYYGPHPHVKHMVCTHCDQDHASGLRAVIQQVSVENLWVHQPWLYAEQLRPQFKGNWTAEGLANHLRNDCFATVSELCDLAEAIGIPIREPMAGAPIGPFTVMSPTKRRLLDLVPRMDQTPTEKTANVMAQIFRRSKKAIYGLFETWQIETLQDPGLNGTSVPNETSVILYSTLAGGVLLTGDAGVGALSEAIDVAAYLGTAFDRPAFVQVPHHGSRHNVSPAVLDAILGVRLPAQVGHDRMSYASVASDSEMPRRQVENAFRRRGYDVQKTAGRTLTWNRGFPNRPGWTYGLEPGSFHSYVEN